MDPIAYAKEKANELKEKRKRTEARLNSDTVQNARNEARAAYQKRVHDRCNDNNTKDVDLRVTIVVSLTKR